MVAEFILFDLIFKRSSSLDNLDLTYFKYMFNEDLGNIDVEADDEGDGIFVE